MVVNFLFRVAPVPFTLFVKCLFILNIYATSTTIETETGETSADMQLPGPRKGATSSAAAMSRLDTDYSDGDDDDVGDDDGNNNLYIL